MGNKNPEEISLSEQIQELERELGLRRSVYPALVHNNKMDYDDMEHHIAALEAAINTLKTLHEQGYGAQEDIFSLN